MRSKITKSFDKLLSDRILKIKMFSDSFFSILILFLRRLSWKSLQVDYSLFYCKLWLKSDKKLVNFWRLKLIIELFLMFCNFSVISFSWGNYLPVLSMISLFEEKRFLFYTSFLRGKFSKTLLLKQTWNKSGLLNHLESNWILGSIS